MNNALSLIMVLVICPVCLAQDAKPAASGTVEVRGPKPGSAIAGSASDVAILPDADRDRQFRVQQLLRQMEVRGGMVPGTVTVRGGYPGGVLIEHDLGKVLQNKVNKAQWAFGDVAPPSNAPTSLSAANVEYRVTNDHSGGESLVAVKSDSDVVASAAKSGYGPQTVTIDIVGLSATQLADGRPDPEVNLVVNGLTRRLKAGESATFENFEVVVQSSVDLRKQKSVEGPPFALRLFVKPKR